MKKGQVETMGLVIIVVLVIMIGLFFLVFSTRGKSNTEQDLILTMRINNLVNSLRYVSVGASNFEQRVMDCCAGLDELACRDMQETAQSGMALIDEKTTFSVKCAGGEETKFGNCNSGLSSVEITLSSGDFYSALICRK